MAVEANHPRAGVGSYEQFDIVLPSQHFGPQRKAPEQRLMTAVLRDALECVEKYRFAADTYGRRTFFEAKQWFLADETEWPYCFERICETLDLDSNVVRQRLRVAPACQPAPVSRAAVRRT
jgi:hypothetical protein